MDREFAEAFKEEIELDEVLKSKDKSVIDAFYDKDSLVGRLLSTNGRSLQKHGMGGQTIAAWLKDKIAETINKKILILKTFVVAVLIIVGVLSLPILSSSGYVHFKHALEWNYFLGVIIFYLFTFMFWKKKQ